MRGEKREGGGIKGEVNKGRQEDMKIKVSKAEKDQGKT